MREYQSSHSKLFPGERLEAAARPSFQFPRFSDAQSLAEELLKRPGRFRSPLSFAERVKLKFFATTGLLDTYQFSRHFFFVSGKSDLPFSWQVLFRYLYQNDMLKSVSPRWSLFSFDHPASASIVLFESEKYETHGHANTNDPLITLSKAVGELLERVALGGRPESSVHASIDLLDRKRVSFLDPRRISHFSDEQRVRLPRLGMNVDKSIDWVVGRNIFSGRTLIPLQCVRRGSVFDFDDSVILRDANSNGCAGHFTLKEAVLAGIYENVERDGFLIFWLNAIAPPVIDPTSVKDPDFQKLLERFSRYQFEARFLNTTTDIGIPSFLCVLIDRSGRGPRIAVGGGCGWDVERALIETGYKTLASFQKTIQTDEQQLAPELSSDYVPFSLRTLKKRERVLLWQNPAMYPKIEPFLSGPKQALQEAFPNLPHFKGVQEEYDYVKNIFQKLGKGYEIYYYEARHPVLRRIGYHVVKVIIPEIVHLYLNEALPPLAASRLKTVPTKLGYKTAKEWNPWPHPFP